VDDALAHSALERAIQKLPMKARVIARPGLGSNAEVLV
jgi:ribosomal protein L16/L10AE